MSTIRQEEVTEDSKQEETKRLETELTVLDTPVAHAEQSQGAILWPSQAAAEQADRKQDTTVKSEKRIKIEPLPQIPLIKPSAKKDHPPNEQ